MTGTAWPSRREFKKVYRKRVVRIPTHRPVNRIHLPVRVFRNEKEKLDEVAAQVILESWLNQQWQQSQENK